MVSAASEEPSHKRQQYHSFIFVADRLVRVLKERRDLATRDGTGSRAVLRFGLGPPCAGEWVKTYAAQDASLAVGNRFSDGTQDVIVFRGLDEVGGMGVDNDLSSRVLRRIGNPPQEPVHICDLRWVDTILRLFHAQHSKIVLRHLHRGQSEEAKGAVRERPRGQLRRGPDLGAQFERVAGTVLNDMQISYVHKRSDRVANAVHDVTAVPLLEFLAEQRGGDVGACGGNGSGLDHIIGGAHRARFQGDESPGAHLRLRGKDNRVLGRRGRGQHCSLCVVRCDLPGSAPASILDLDDCVAVLLGGG